MNLEDLKNELHSIYDTCKTEIRDLNDDELKRVDEIKLQVEELRKLEEVKEEKKDTDEEQTENEHSEDEAPVDEEKDEVETPKEDEPDDKEEKSCGEDKENNKRNLKTNISKMEKRFSLVAELRNAYETGKKINLNEIENRAYSVTDEGEDVVMTDIYDIWKPLRTQNVLVAAGAKLYSGIKNNIQIPLMSKVTCGFASELGAASDGSGAFTKKVLSPKRITAKYPISLELLAQDSIGIENAIREDISKALAAKLEETILGSSTGDTNTPAGIFSNTAVTTGSVANFSGVCTLEEAVEGAGVDMANCKYIVSPSAKASLRNMAKSAKSTQLVMEGAEIDGTPVLTTAHVPSGKYVYGDFSNIVLATWDNVQIDVVRDTASLANGVVTIVVNAFVDGALVRPEGLAFGTVA